MSHLKSQSVGSGNRTSAKKGPSQLAASPTLRRRRLARQLLLRREAKGLTAKTAATEAKKLSPDRKWSETKVHRIENRKILRVRDIDVQTLLDVYEVTDPIERDAYRRLAREASQSGWWVGYRDVLGTGAYVDLETEATRLRSYDGMLIPGLFQNEAYARAVVRGGGIVDGEMMARRVEARMIRKQILERPDAPKVWSIIDEAALLKVPKETGQLEHLIKIQRPNLRVQVLPNTAGPHAAMTGGFTIMDFPHDPSTVYLEQARSGLFLEDPADVEHYGDLYDYVQAGALGVDESIAFVEDLIRSQ